MLKGAVKLLANKGYEGATIIEIAEASDISRGSCTIILKTKRILPQKPYLVVLLKWCNHLAGLKGKSTEEIVNNVIDMHIKKARDNPDFYRFLFEMSYLSSHNKKVYDEFIICQDKVIDAIVNWLEDALDKGLYISNQEKQNILQKSCHI